MKQHTYIAIDLKSFYASVECRERGLDPLDTNLVVADESRTDKTICLAVTPSLKSYGISGRGRLFEVKQRVKEANAGRQHDAPGHRLDGTSHFYSELQANPYLAIDFIIAPPRMAYYMEYSTRIYQVYLKYIAPEDIVVYSIDEVFISHRLFARKRGQNSYRSFLARTVQHCQRYLCAFHPNEPTDSEKPLFYTIIHGMQQQISADTVALFLKKYGKMAHNSCPEVPAHIHAHMLRHTRAMHLYHQRMPMMLLSE